MQESVFHKVAQFIKVFIVRSLLGAVFLWRNYRLHALIPGLLQNIVAVISLIRQKIPGTHPLNQAASLRTISCGTLRDKDSDRHTMRIHGQMYFCVEPPFVRLMS